ncbi:uncharacterized protein V1518DRAFT_415924 [Limtongia smithiae]|uniref:uncharacterized protein n=1 Tax=Limtongia smithiae TaxID=1125753 RepID=UPI0034CE12A3
MLVDRKKSEDDRAELRSVMRIGLIYGALSGTVVAAVSSYVLYNFSRTFRRMPVSLKSYYVVTCMFAGAIMEQNKRAKQHVYMHHWQEASGLEPPKTLQEENKELLEFTEDLRQELRGKPVKRE